MVTMLDCIKRTAPTVNSILDHAQEYTDDLVNYLADGAKKIDEIVLVASGSSNNAGVTASSFMELASGLQVKTYVPNQFKNKKVYNPNALYIFVSQSGTSTLVEQQVEMVNNLGYYTCSVTDDDTSPITKLAKAYVPLGVGGEEFGYRTVGFVSSVVVLQIIALRIGLERGHIDSKTYNEYLQDGKKAVENHPKIVEKTLAWFDKHADKLKEGKCFMYYGSDTLYGIALEGALKLLETAKIPLSIGYEAEDGLHGPNLGFTKGDVVIGLYDGENDHHYTSSVVKFSKEELGQGYYFGPDPIDNDDLVFDVCSKYFRAVEFAPAVEIVSYKLALIHDVPVLPMSERQPHASAKYFQTHSK